MLTNFPLATEQMLKTIAHNALYLVVAIAISIGVIHFEQPVILLLYYGWLSP
jgi:hypothetical protein